MISVLHLRTLDYGTALELQKSLVELRHQQRISDVLLLLEHPPVITLGRNASQKNLLASNEVLQRRGVELFESNRGGDVTFHGPGQLVGYPIFDLRAFTPRIGAVEFVRRVEEALIRTCGDFGIPTQRICGLTGVWTLGADVSTCVPADASPTGRGDVPSKKIAAIGVHISRGITSHGFALNVTTDLDYFKLIVPCGISDRPVTSVVEELGPKRVPAMEDVAHKVSLNFGRVFERQMLWLESLDSLIRPADGEQSEDHSPAAPSTTIGVPLRVPKEIQGVANEQKLPAIVDEIQRA